MARTLASSGVDFQVTQGTWGAAEVVGKEGIEGVCAVAGRETWVGRTLVNVCGRMQHIKSDGISE